MHVLAREDFSLHYRDFPSKILNELATPSLEKKNVIY